MLTDTLTNLLSPGDLPEPAPVDPMPLLRQWLDEAKASGKYQDPNAMALATTTREGAPSVRIVLAKAIENDPPAIVFYTNYTSRKGGEIEANPRVAAVFHWHFAERQARIEGVASRVSAEESDAYFHSRPVISRIGAAVSDQSKPIASRAQLVDKAMKLAGQAATGRIERPAHWGGYRIALTRVELWAAAPGRLHQRVQWTRSDEAQSGGWTHVLLSP